MKRNKKIRCILCIALAVVLFFSSFAYLFTAMAESTDTFYKTVMIDCGRSYYSVEQIKKIIDQASDSDYGQVMLLFGNDGLRFLLDDMSVTDGSSTYDGDTIANAVKAQNASLPENSYSGASAASGSSTAGAGEWTESDMDEILSYASSKNIRIIPGIDVPGHATSIVAAMDKSGISNCYVSSRNSSSDGGSATINIADADAYAFAEALLQKYIDYFRAKGCTEFCIGMDEYAGNNGGYSHMTDDEKTALSSLLSDLCGSLNTAGMTPLAFCDVIGNLSSVPSSLTGINWNGGYLKNNKNINANDNWYYVLGDPFGSGSGQWGSYAKALQHVSDTSVTTPLSGSADAGCLLAVWNDYYKAVTDEYITNICNLMKAQAKANPSYFTPASTVSVVVKEGASKDITLTDASITAGTYQVDPDGIASAEVIEVSQIQKVLQSVESLAEGEQYVIVLNRTGKALSSVPDGTRLSLESSDADVNSETWTWTGSSFKNSEGKYLTIASGSAGLSETETSLSVSHVDSVSAWEIGEGSYYLNQYGGQSSSQAGGWTSGAASDAGSRWQIYGIVDGTESETVKQLHISGIKEGSASVTIGRTTYEIQIEASDNKRTVYVKKGETYEEDADDSWEEKSYDTDDASIASVKVAEVSETATEKTLGGKATVITSGKQYVITSNNNSQDDLVLTSTASGTGLLLDGTPSADSEKWTITETGTSGSYYIRNEAGKYLSVTNGSVSLSDTAAALSVSYLSSVSSWQAGTEINGTNYYLNRSGGGTSTTGYTNGAQNGHNSRWNLYEITDTEVTKTVKKLQITGLEEGMTTAEVGDVLYTIHVYDDSKTYETITLDKGSTSVYTFPEQVEDGAYQTSDESVAKAIVATENGVSSVTFTGLKAGSASVEIGNYVFQIKVNAADLSNVNLTYYPFISDYPVYASGTSSGSMGNEGTGNPQTLSAGSENVNSEDGAELSSLVWATGDWKWEGNSVETMYWKGVLHDAAHKQVGSTFDQSTLGDDFYYIRYFNGKWSVSFDQSSWTDITDQEVCVYYLQKTDITQEIITYVKDWAFRTTSSDYSQYSTNSKGHKALTFGVVYPDGTVHPADGDMYDDSTLIYWADTGITSDTDTMLMRFEETADYKIEKITYTYGNISSESADGGTLSWKQKTSLTVPVGGTLKIPAGSTITSGTYEPADPEIFTSDADEESGSSYLSFTGLKEGKSTVTINGTTYSVTVYDMSGQKQLIIPNGGTLSFTSAGDKTGVINSGNTASVSAEGEYSKADDVTTVVLTGVSEGSSNVTIGDISYQVVVKPSDDSTWYDETTYWENGTNVLTSTRSDTIVRTSDFLTYGDNSYDANDDALLLLVYVTPKDTEDTLHVHYIDKTDNTEFYNYGIQVNSGTVFDASAGLNQISWQGPLDHGTVTNINGTEQTVTADLQGIALVADKYKTKPYVCTEVKRSDDGKDLYLYYELPDIKTYALSVMKKVTGNGGNRDEQFDFTLTLTNTETDLSGQTITADLPDGTQEAVQLNENGTYAFKLADSSMISFAGIPEGTNYSIAEDTPEGYKVTIEGAQSGTLDSSTNVVFTNDKVYYVPSDVRDGDMWAAAVLFAAGAAGLACILIIKKKKP